MAHMSYNRVSSNSRRLSSCQGSCRGFRLNPRRIYVLRLRKRFTFFLRLFDKCKLSYSQALHLLKKVFHKKGSFKRNSSSSSSNSNSSNSSLVRKQISYGRSNSFYAEAIADCLEFIKRTSISMDQIQDPVSHIQDRNSWLHFVSREKVNAGIILYLLCFRVSFFGVVLGFWI